MHSCLRSDQFTHCVCVSSTHFWWGIQSVIQMIYIIFSCIDNNDVKILQKLSWLLLLYLWGVQNCRQQKVFKRLCKKSVLCIFWNKARELRQIMGSSCGLQNMRRAFEAMDKWYQKVNGIWNTNSFEGAYKSC